MKPHPLTTTQTDRSRRQMLQAMGVGSVIAVAGGVLTSGESASASGANDTLVNVLDYGATGNGTTDDLASIQSAIDAANARGGGVVFFPPGQYRISNQLNLGDGSNSAVSTKHHRITLAGSGKGGSPSLNFVQNPGATEIIYDGPTSSTAAVLSLEGPLHSVTVENLVLNAASKAGYGIRLNHVTDSYFCAVMTRQPTVAGWILTTRTGFPPACTYGCANNVLIHCWAYDPGPSAHGMILTSGVPTTSSLTGNPDSANNDIIGGCYFYPGSAGTAGFYIYGADNNTIYGAQAIPSGGTGGNSVYFKPWDGDTRFPLENAFHSMGMSQPVGGTSGSLGNTFTIFQNGDGAPLPAIPYINALTHLGVEVAFGKRSYRIREIDVAEAGSPYSVTGSSYVVVPDLQKTMSSLIVGSSKLKISYTGIIGKIGGGTNDIILAVDGTTIRTSAQQVTSASGTGNCVATAVVNVTAASHTIAVYMRSTGGGTATLYSGALTVEELY